MDEARGHYIKLNNPGSGRQILYDITYMLNLKKKDELLEAKSRKVLLRGGGLRLCRCWNTTF
jgi:hypothetical protein